MSHGNGHVGVDSEKVGRRFRLCDADAERSILRACDSFGTLEFVRRHLGDDAKVFYAKSRRLIYEAHIGIADSHGLIDGVLVGDCLARRGSDVGDELATIRERERVAPEVLRRHVAIVRDLAARRRLTGAMDQLKSLVLNRDTELAEVFARMRRVVSEAETTIEDPSDGRAEPEEVDAAATLDAVVTFVRRYVVLTEPQAWAVALWVAHTHAFEAAESTPYLSVSSAEKRSGKTRLLDVVERLVAKPWRAIQPSEAVMYRKIDVDGPTLLLDEVDTIFGPRAPATTEGLRAILNAGYRRGTTVPRCVGEGANLEVVNFKVFSPKALAGIGNLPDTVADRCMPIRLQRAAPGERAAAFRSREVDVDAEPVRANLSAWAAANIEQLAAARPKLPAGMNDRAAEGFEPLLAIAELAGGEWLDRAQTVATELYGGEAEHETIKTRLLADIRRVFDERKCERIATSELLDVLRADEEGPWCDYRGKPLSPKGLATLLKPFEIHSKTIRLEDETTPKGFDREQFDDAFRRYLSPPPENGPFPATAATTRINTGIPAATLPPQPTLVAGNRDGANPHEHSDVAAVAGKQPSPDQGELSATSQSIPGVLPPCEQRTLDELHELLDAREVA